MKKVFLNFGLLLTMSLATTVFNSCNKNDNGEKQSIQLQNKQDLTQIVYADETEVGNSIRFTTTGSWTSTIKTPTALLQQTFSSNTMDWISISPDHGDKAGDYTIQILLEVNFTGADRTVQIVISSGGTEVTITVTQRAITENGKTPTDSKEPDNPNMVSYLQFRYSSLLLSVGDVYEPLCLLSDFDWNIDWNDAFAAISVTSSDENKVAVVWTPWTGSSVRDFDYKVTAIAEGTAIITAKVGNKTTTCKVIVINGVLINGIRWCFAGDNHSTNPKDYYNVFDTTGSWRIPTKTELQSLVNAGSEWVVENGVSGRRFGSGSNTLFLPAVGYDKCYFCGNAQMEYHSIEEIGSNGYYWGNDFNCYLSFSESDVLVNDVGYNYGNSYSGALYCR